MEAEIANDRAVEIIQTRLFETQEQLAAKITELGKRMDALDAEKKEVVWKAKFIIGMMSILITIAGYVGIHYSYRDLMQSLEARIDTELRKGALSEDRTFYHNLMAGSALNTSQRYSAAITRLLQCFTEGHYYDPAVLVPLLNSIYMNDDWESAATVLAVLNKNNSQYEHINDATVLAYLGAIQVQAGIDHPEWLENGFATLKRAQASTLPGDSGTTGLIYTNYWIYHLQHHDLASANAIIDSMKVQEFTVFSWRVIRQEWKFFRRFFANGQNRDIEPKIKSMWERLSDRNVADNRS